MRTLSLSPGAPNIRIAIVGPNDDLNSSFLLSFLGLPELDPTITNTFSKTMYLDGSQLQVHVISSTAQEGYTTLRDTHLRQSHGFVCLYDSSDKQSLSDLLVDDIIRLERVMETLDIPMIFFANGTVDKGDEQAAKKSIKEAVKYNPTWIQGNVTEGRNVQECMWDLVRMILRYNEKQQEIIKKKKKRKCVIV
jgi:hypothetical protein